MLTGHVPAIHRPPPALPRQSRSLAQSRSQAPTLAALKNPGQHIEQKDIYRSMAIGAGIGGVSGAVSSLFGSHSAKEGALVGAGAGILNGAAVGYINRHSNSSKEAYVYSALASAGISIGQNLLLGKTEAKSMVYGVISGAMRGIIVSRNFQEKGAARSGSVTP